MTTKLALILTGAWTLLMIAVCSGLIWFVTARVPRHEQERRAGMLGSGAATVAAIGYGAIWLPWAVVVGRKRRERAERERAEQDRRKDRDRDRPAKRRRKSADDDDGDEG